MTGEPKEMSPETMKQIEAMMQFHGVKEGDTFTKRQVEAIDHLFPGMRSLKMQSTTIKFDNGKPYVEGENKFGISVDGKQLEERASSNEI